MFIMVLLSPSPTGRNLINLFYLRLCLATFYVLRNLLLPFPRPPHNANGARALNLMECSGQLFQSRGSLDSAVTFWMCPKCGAVVIGFGEPYTLACKI